MLNMRCKQNYLKLFCGIFGIFFIILIYFQWKPDNHSSLQINLTSNFLNYTYEELEFPIAYTIIVYRDEDQFLRLLKAIYRTQNIYCIHADPRSPNKLLELVDNLTKQYSNIIAPSHSIKVYHSLFSVLESEVLCIKALLANTKVNWKYFINLTGQEWPLKVNLELVRILKSLKGANLLEKISYKDIKARIPLSKGPPPHGIKIWKGAIHIVASRAFMEFSITDKKALDLMEYLRDTFVPDESFFSTLNNDHSFKAPGGYSGDLERHPINLPFFVRYKIWETEGNCYGVWLRGICIFSKRDLPALLNPNNVHLFANKFVKNINYDVLDTVEQWFYNRSRVVYSNVNTNPFIDLQYYSNLEVVKHHY